MSDVESEKAYAEHKEVAPTNTDYTLDNGSPTNPEANRTNTAYLKSLKYTEEEEKALVRKFDLRLTSFLSLLYLVAFLDRSNIGNAHTAGLAKDLGLSDIQYQWLLTIFYIFYICGQSLILMWKVLPPKYYVFVVVMGWGVVATCQAATVNWAGMMVLRGMLGLFEAGYGPGVPYYLTIFYYRHEVTYRVSAFMVVPPIASAFAGALAYGITYHKHAIESWRILFIVEGFPTVILAVLCLWFIPNSPYEMRSLTDREKDIAAARLVRQVGSAKRDTSLKFSDALHAFRDIKNICTMIMFFCVNVAFAALPIYLPTLIKEMGYTSVNAQGLSAPPYIVAAFCTVLAAWVAEKTKRRGLVIAFGYVVAAVGYIILINVKTKGVRYFALYLCCSGIYPIVANLLVWNLQGSDGKKSFGYVLMATVGQCGPILGTRIFPAKDGPYYRKGGWISVGCLLLGACTAVFLTCYFAYKNRQLDKQYGKPLYTSEELIKMQTSGAGQIHSTTTKDRNEELWVDSQEDDVAGLESTANKNFRYQL